MARPGISSDGLVAGLPHENRTHLASFASFVLVDAVKLTDPTLGCSDVAPIQVGIMDRVRILSWCGTRFNFLKRTCSSEHCLGA